MGYSKAQKTKTHERIVKLASKRFREVGLARIGIAELMKEAGLTVGGFYKHFNSRDHLVAEAVNSAFGGWKRRVEAAKSGGPPVSYEKLVDDYLNEAHRDNPGTGCAFSSQRSALVCGPRKFDKTAHREAVAVIHANSGLSSGHISLSSVAPHIS
jgi:TetR/AcrR family transcriptional repressor of nem operon